MEIWSRATSKASACNSISRADHAGGLRDPTPTWTDPPSRASTLCLCDLPCASAIYGLFANLDPPQTFALRSDEILGNERQMVWGERCKCSPHTCGDRGAHNAKLPGRPRAAHPFGLWKITIPVWLSFRLELAPVAVGLTGAQILVGEISCRFRLPSERS